MSTGDRTDTPVCAGSQEQGKLSDVADRLRMGAEEKLHFALRYAQTPIYLQKPQIHYTQALTKRLLLQELHLHIQ